MGLTHELMAELANAHEGLAMALELLTDAQEQVVALQQQNAELRKFEQSLLHEIEILKQTAQIARKRNDLRWLLSCDIKIYTIAWCIVTYREFINSTSIDHESEIKSIVGDNND
jgi:hypothetical protein